MKKILIATKNQGKVEDFKTIFKEYKIDVISLLDLEEPIDDIEETGESFAENAILKAETIAKKLNIPVLADDSGLSIDQLDGRPGVYSARYSGMERNDRKNYMKVLRELEGVADEDRTAQFTCALALVIPGKDPIVKYGTCNGHIINQPIGENGFGYDPVFMPTGFDRTMAQLSIEEKNKISHRGRAIKELAKWLESHKEVYF